jgi:hypothetical protein
MVPIRCRGRCRRFVLVVVVVVVVEDYNNDNKERRTEHRVQLPGSSLGWFDW